jgi:DEAD/DEAH box helicase domain-containing protein
MDALGFLESIRTSKGYRGQIVHIEHIPRREPSFREINPPVSGDIGRSLADLGITRFYSHQAESVEAVRRGESIVVVTATASGKTLCYNIPVVETLLEDPRARALYIYPTKALAQDQLAKLRQYRIPGLRPSTYDGDTPRHERPFIKASANIVLTNPDMLHVGILPYHTTWAGLFRNLKYVVIDEVHSYRGVFGSHVANIMRRLRRVAEYYGSRPQFVCASATVRDPGKLVGELTGVDVRVIDNDGSPAGEKAFVFWNPSYLAGKGERRSANSEAVGLFTRLVQSGIRTIVFTKARKTAELILRYSRQEMAGSGSSLTDKIMSYRAGYRPAERREIERRLFSGELLGVTSTTALEVGVDIGGLDAVVMTGYPGSVAGTWQQAGRAGRGTQQSLAVLIALDNPIDQFLMRNPGYFLSSAHERAIVDARNPYILADHLLCAAYEMPIENSEVEPLFGERAWEVLGLLQEVGQLSYRRRWYWTGGSYPAGKVNIRSASGESFNIVSVEQGGMLLGSVDSSSAFDTVHPGAIYLHGGESYVVTKLNIDERVAYVERTDVSYYTTPGDRTRVRVREVVESRTLGATTAHFGDVVVANQVTHYWRKQLFTDRMIERIPLDLPEVELATEAAWIAIPREFIDRLVGRGFDLTGTIHAIEHASIGMLPLFALCDRSDIGGVSHPEHPDTDGLAAIFIYDGHEGGVGLARTAYDGLEELLEATLQAIEGCACEDGCPSCIQSPKCGNNNEPLDKAGALFLLRELLTK